jgi:hypothetical protein
MSEDKYKSIKIAINRLGVDLTQILQPEKLEITKLREIAEQIEEVSQTLLSDIEDLEYQLEGGE